MAKQEEYIEDAIAHRLDHEEVGGPDAPHLVAQEGPPALVVTRPDSAPPVAPNGAVADDDAELEQFAADALAAPKRILLGNSGDQRPDFGTQVRPAQSGAGFPGPVQSPALPVPAHDRRRSDHVKVLPPALGPDAAQPDPRRPDRVFGAEDVGWCAGQLGADDGAPSSRARDLDASRGQPENYER